MQPCNHARTLVCSHARTHARSQEAIDQKLVDLIKQRGKKGTNRRDQIEKLRSLRCATFSLYKRAFEGA